MVSYNQLIQWLIFDDAAALYLKCVSVCVSDKLCVRVYEVSSCCG